MPRTSSQGGLNTLLSVVLFFGLPGLTSAQREDVSKIPLQKGHTHAILEVKWSPNDQLLLTYSAADGFLNLWKMPEGRLITSIEDWTIKIKGNDKRALRAFAWSNDSRFIATGSENGTAQIWEAETGRLLWTTRIADEYVTGVGFSHDGRYLAAIASPEDEKHKLVLLDSTSGRILKELGGIQQRFLTYYHDARLVFSDDNRWLLVGDIGGIITRWDLARGSLADKKTLSVCTTEGRMPNAFSYNEDLSLLAKQLRPQDRVLVVTFDRLIMLLTEATNDSNVVTEVVERNAITGFSTRLYDALDLVIKTRLNKIEGRKAIVLFTDGVDTASYQATYKSTLREVEELDALIYPVQYDTTDFVDAQTRTNATIVTTTIRGPHLPTRSSSRVTYGTPKASGPGTSVGDYKLADQYLQQLATKTGGRLYAANDRSQLNGAFSKIAEELRHQYSIGYYPQTTPVSDERREIKVRVDQPDVAVRARDSYVRQAGEKR